MGNTITEGRNEIGGGGSKGYLSEEDFETLERRLDFIFEGLLVLQATRRDRTRPIPHYLVYKELKIVRMWDEFKRKYAELEGLWDDMKNVMAAEEEEDERRI